MENAGADLLGIHLEGPFLAKEFKGAMPEHLLRDADVELLKEYQEDPYRTVGMYIKESGHYPFPFRIIYFCPFFRHFLFR